MNGIISINVGFIYIKSMKLTLRKTNGAIKNEQSRDTCDMRYIRHRKKTKKNKKTKNHTHTMPHRKPIKAIKNGQSIDTGNMRHIKKQAEDKQTAKTSKKHNTAK